MSATFAVTRAQELESLGVDARVVDRENDPVRCRQVDALAPHVPGKDPDDDGDGRDADDTQKNQREDRSVGAGGRRWNGGRVGGLRSCGAGRRQL